MRALGERVLVAVVDIDAAAERAAMRAGACGDEGGVVESVLLRGEETDRDEVEADMELLRDICVRLGLETEPTLRITADPPRSMKHAAIGHDASLVFAAEDGEHYAATLERLGAKRDESGTWIF